MRKSKKYTETVSSGGEIYRRQPPEKYKTYSILKTPIQKRKTYITKSKGKNYRIQHYAQNRARAGNVVLKGCGIKGDRKVITTGRSNRYRLESRRDTQKAYYEAYDNAYSVAAGKLRTSHIRFVVLRWYYETRKVIWYKRKNI